MIVRVVFMKKIIKILIPVLILSLSFCACSTNQQKTTILPNDDVTTKMLKHFNDQLSFDDVMGDIENVDLYFQPDYSDLKEKVEKDDESSTAKRYFYDGNKLLYCKYEGYGEDSFDYYTKSKSGKDITVKYVDNDKVRNSVSIEGENYNVSYSDLNKENEYKADTIYVTVGNLDNLDNCITYCYSNNNVHIDSAYYYSNDGYHKYTASLNDDNQYESFDDVYFAMVDNVEVDNSLCSMFKDYMLDDCEMLVGNQKFVYFENDNNEKTWYVTGDFYAVFDNRNKANAFAKKYNVEVKQSDTDEDFWISEFKGTTFMISPEFKDFYKTATSDDYYYTSVKFDKNGNITKFDDSNAKLSYY